MCFDFGSMNILIYGLAKTLLVFLSPFLIPRLQRTNCDSCPFPSYMPFKVK